ncbi:MAG TPA: glycosyltransferase family 4 protein [Patescibacteria group bacterium]|nr:glycosyltransferase family 4 protein [Patescibacteria group bacterium]
MIRVTMSRPDSEKPRLVFVANTMYSNIVSGGEIHTFNLTASALAAGYHVHFFTGHAMKAELERRGLPVTISVTDKQVMTPRDFGTLAGQFSLLFDYRRRLNGTLPQLDQIKPDDIVYSATDFWWDIIPVLRSRARRKIMYLGMDCPTLAQIIFKTRPDVKTIRLPSLHYWLTQQMALRRFRRCCQKRLIYTHYNQKPRLLRMGYREEDLVFVSNGVDLKQPAAVPEQKKIYDAAWVGRVHKQKGIDDLIATLRFLSSEVQNFRAIMVGDLQKMLAPQVAAAGLADHVEFSGYVSESEKFRLLKSSRVFLMPSQYESWGIVVGEALASGLPVVAYELDAYRPVFGDLLRYVPAFDLEAFKHASAEEIQKARVGANRLDQVKLKQFIRENSWEAVGQRFLATVSSLEKIG